jgi:uncharacterized membrane protein YdjX (TVP38/TMEM64 family)
MMERKGAGKRRSKASTLQSEQSKNSGSQQSSQNNSNGNVVVGGADSGGNIDSFLQRLDDMDLGHGKKRKNRAASSALHRGDVESGSGGIAEGGLSSSSARIRVDDDNGDDYHKKSSTTTTAKTPLTKRIALIFMAIMALIVIHDMKHSPPDKRLFGAHRIEKFLLWVKEHPGTGAAAFVVVYGTCVVLLLPGTPLTLGGGYVYKITYGLAGGVTISTILSLAGSLIGSCTCFILGRYIMRDRVRKWGRKYPLFDSIDIAVSDNGFKIMCLLYLTPILPLGPVAYMCGTTSMPLFSFAAAKIGAAPLTLLYAFIGASTDTFFGSGTADGGGGSSISGGGVIARETSTTTSKSNNMGMDEETHKKMVLFGLVLSVLSMSLVSHVVKKEIHKIFDKQKKDKQEDADSLNGHEASSQLEMTTRNNETLQRRQRGHDEEKG